ncbi:MAG: DNA-processing protein DprA, partial [Clostridia bacterium]|nr:DNA-processing protein DprA [Clostridia bacterium]
MKYLVWLQSVLLEGSNKVLTVLEFFGNAKTVFETEFKVLKASGIFSPKELERIKNTSITSAEKTIDNCKQKGIELIGITNDRYPDILRNIPNPPLVLYIKGEFPDFDNEPAICIVGPRKVSDFGKKSAYSLALRLAKSGITVVSGCALGSDSAAHIGALKAGGKTVGILPCGILNGYLAQNKNLRDNIANNGCIISEYSPEKPVGPTSFKVRNRLLAALSHSTVVVEAASRSGALITAHYACDFGRELFVIPGNPTFSH